MKATDFSNCKTDYDYNLLDLNSQNSIQPTTTSNNLFNSDSECSNSIASSSEDFNLQCFFDDYEQKITLEYCSNTYFAKTFFDQFKYPKC
jgi:hypothetical protein